MSEREIVAYALIALMLLAGAAIYLWNSYHSRTRTEGRRLNRLAKRDRQRDADTSEVSDRG